MTDNSFVGGLFLVSLSDWTTDVSGAKSPNTSASSSANRTGELTAATLLSWLMSSCDCKDISDNQPFIQSDITDGLTLNDSSHV